MAAAYLFHISQNQPFNDGNKRTGLAAALVFLDLNGVSVEREAEAMAQGKAGKAEVARELARLFPGAPDG
jgi:death-on-curing protein